jgi:hypothetical protein
VHRRARRGCGLELAVRALRWGPPWARHCLGAVMEQVEARSSDVGFESGENLAWESTSIRFSPPPWYVFNVSIIFDAPYLFLHHLLSVSLHFVALLCIFRN